jgi:hypothetical protein
MKLKYLGDAKDLAKRSIFALLRGDGTPANPDLLGKLFVVLFALPKNGNKEGEPAPEMKTLNRVCR